MKLTDAVSLLSRFGQGARAPNFSAYPALKRLPQTIVIYPSDLPHLMYEHFNYDQADLRPHEGALAITSC